jgi:hypothetical protein
MSSHVPAGCNDRFFQEIIGLIAALFPLIFLLSECATPEDVYLLVRAIKSATAFERHFMVNYFVDYEDLVVVMMMMCNGDNIITERLFRRLLGGNVCYNIVFPNWENICFCIIVIAFTICVGVRIVEKSIVVGFIRPSHIMWIVKL